MTFLAGLLTGFFPLSIALGWARARRKRHRVVECPMCHGLSVDSTGETIVHCAHPECGVLFIAEGGWLFK